MTSTSSADRNETQQQFQTAVKRAMYFIPLYLLVPAAFWLIFHYSGTEMEWKAFGLGALGWTIALFLRGPLSAIVMKMPKDKAAKIIIGSSGVFEESIRVALLLLTSMSYSWALSIGQGWAAVEVLFTVINLIVMASLAKRTDDKSMQAKEMLKLQGNLNKSPLWGVIERVFASAFHIGCTLIVAKHPWTVAILIPLHSFLNLATFKFSKTSIVKTEILLAIIGTITFVAGILLFHY
ncbi:YhfC family glutamic-type intramembrane protease [Paenibacillus sp. L3-i20]|uniref:YhfC family glutamic-type intramembrane protease n=1 Tax=Paenibacillus sp. L3-i20 TaxID=2905833 RepID=UPI001EDE9560|nr:YhfC family glutamic-type intramembrane protease [Paenibacillus sp. L3-i20]GKU77308.1 hypothetical protein L3i20_v217050 [Paenibacillus sp. L3-i20]